MLQPFRRSWPRKSGLYSHKNDYIHPSRVIPIELWLEIISWMDVDQLKTMALLSVDIYKLVLPLLFKHITLSSPRSFWTWERPALSQSTLEIIRSFTITSKHIRSRKDTHSLSVGDKVTNWFFARNTERFCRGLTQLRELGLSNIKITPSLYNFIHSSPTLSTLAVDEYVSFSSHIQILDIQQSHSIITRLQSICIPTELSHYLSALLGLSASSLEHLQLKHCSWRGPTAHIDQLSASGLPKLHTLSIAGMSGGQIQRQSIRQLIASAPSLKNLTLGGWDSETVRDLEVKLELDNLESDYDRAIELLRNGTTTRNLVITYDKATCWGQIDAEQLRYLGGSEKLTLAVNCSISVMASVLSGKEFRNLRSLEVDILIEQIRNNSLRADVNQLIAALPHLTSLSVGIYSSCQLYSHCDCQLTYIAHQVENLWTPVRTTGLNHLRIRLLDVNGEWEGCKVNNEWKVTCWWNGTCCWSSEKSLV